MGVVVPNFASSTLDRASGAQVIDGSLKFDSSQNQFLQQTFGADGNKKTFTYSFWAKKTLQSQSGGIIFSGDNNVDGNNFEFRDAADKLRVYSYQNNSAVDYRTTAEYRDTNGWKHFVVSIDSTNGTASDRMKLYVNGERVTNFSTSTGTWGSNTDYKVNTSGENHYIGLLLNSSGAQSTWFDGQMSQWYFIDGQSLGPEYFGFTDPLTNTWKPKKFSGDFNGYTLTAPTYNSGQGSDVTTSEFDKMVDGDLSTYGQGNGASGTNRFIGFSLAATAYPSINVKIKNTTGSALDFIVQPSVSGSGLVSQGVFASTGNNNGTVNVAADTTLEDTFSFPSGYEGFGRIYLNNSGNAADAWEIYDFGGTKVTTNSFHLPMDGNSPIGQDQSGNGNSWTPVNFGGSVALDNPQVSGARPILNTLPGGTQAGVGVFGSKQNVGYAVTVYDDGGGNKYYIDGVKQDTVTGLIRGATYTFDTSDSTVSSHPFRFSATSNGSHGGGSEYTNGVAAITGAATTITVPYDAPETLYYYCTSHSGMGADITGITTNEKLADQYASNCTLAIPFVGSKNNVSASIACTSTTGDVTNVNAVASNASSNFYGGSWYFDASGDYLTVPYSADSFDFGTGDFTVEAYVNQLARANYTAIISSTNTSINVTNHWTLGYSNTNDMLSFKLGSGGSSAVTANFSAHYGKWSHVAATRESGTIRLFFDGQEVASATDTSSLTGDTGNAVKIGQRYTNQNAYSFNGYMSDLRVYKGVAKYTSNFVPAAASPDILPDTPSGVSGGSKLTKITDGAVSFDGTGDYLSLADSDDIDLTGDISFTVEAFIYKTDSAEDQIFEFRGGGSTGWTLYTTTSNTLQIYDSVANTQVGTSTGKITPNAWNHIALTKNGSGSNNCNFWINGVNSGTFSLASFATTDSTGLRIGASKDTSAFFTGFMSNVRIVKGTALYTKRFTPPSAPLTNVTNTKLLCCQSNTSATASVVEPSSDGTGYTGNTSAITLSSANLDAGAVANIVDGSTSTVAQIRGAGSFVQMVFPQQQNGTLQVNVANGNDVGDDNIRVFIDGVEGTSFDVSSQQWLTIHTGNFTTVKLEHQGSTTGYIYGFRIGTGGDTIINVSDGITANGDAAATNFNPFITDINTVRGQETGYPTFNPLDSALTLSDGNLNSGTSGASSWKHCRANMAMTTGKFYWEYKAPGPGVPDGNNGYQMGVMLNTVSLTADPNSASTGMYTRQHTTKYANGSSSTPFADAAGKTVMFALDVDAGLMWTGQDGVWYNSGNPVAGTNESWSSVPAGVLPMAGSYGSSFSVDVNFGQKPFKFPPPDGFLPLNTANTRPVKVISRPDQYVGISTWTGDGNNRFIEYGMQPDLFVVKARNDSYRNGWFDSVRGFKNVIWSDQTLAETNSSTYPEDPTPTGITVNNDDGQTNQNTKTYVGWAWKAGGNKNTFNVDDVGYASAAAAGLDGGTIDPIGASVGTKQGFSIIQYQGNGSTDQTISHGLTQAPDFSIFKNMDGTSNWTVFHRSVTTTTQKVFYLNTTGAIADYSGGDSTWWGTLPGASVFTIGATGTAINNGTNDIISYHWHNVPGLQKFGSYLGNDDNNQFVELGFRPALLWIKATTTGTNYTSWWIADAERNKFNPTGGANTLWANKNVAEGTRGDASSTSGLTNIDVDFLSNGFNVTGGNSDEISDATYGPFVYCAWAEAPSIDLYGGGANAR